MEIRTASIYAFMVMMCVNAFAGMLAYVGISGVPMDAIDQDQIQTLNVTQAIESTDFETTAFYNIGQGFLTWWYMCVPVVEAFPELLSNYGCPDFIYKPIHDIWRLMWFTFSLLVVLAGRNL